ncbi:MAG: TonB-dependent receptor, partial [Opitutaceae bacterium]
MTLITRIKTNRLMRVVIGLWISALGAHAAGPAAQPSFEVRDTRVGAYGAQEATSGTRISLPIKDIPQSVTVVTRELIEDTQGLRMIDVARFATPIVEGENGAGDRYSIRGFRTTKRFIDGATIGPQGNSMWSDLSNTERLEIVKGPNAVLAPRSEYGGKMNQITKSPRFETFTQLSLDLRRFLGSEISLDHNRVLDLRQPRDSAMRIVATYWDSTGYFDHQIRRGWLVAPSFVHRFSDRGSLVVKLESLANKESNLLGVALDPAVGTRVGGYARKHPLLPRDNQWPPLDEVRSRQETRLTSEFRFTLGEKIAARLWLTGDHVYYVSPSPGGARHDAGLQGSRDPLTGEWVPFKAFGYNPATGAVTVTNLVPSGSTIFTRPNREVAHERYNEVHAKNDYAIDHRLGSARATTVAGLSANWLFKVQSRAWRFTSPPVDYATGRPVGPDEPVTSQLVRDKNAEQRDIQAFIHQRLHLLRDRLIVSGGVAESYGVLERKDDNALPPILGRTNRNSVTDYQVGMSVKPLPDVSLFAGYNRLTGGLPIATSAGEFPAGSFKVGVGDQREIGLKAVTLNNRVTASVAWFEIVQRNVQMGNIAETQNPLQPRYLFYDLRNRGAELEFNALVTPAIEIVGNVTRMRMRDSHGVPQMGIPDQAAALFAKYTFTRGELKGLAATFGVDYVGRRPGPNLESAAGETLFTPAGVENQPSFYVAPRTLLQAGVSYRTNRWSLAVVVHNL